MFSSFVSDSSSCSPYCFMSSFMFCSLHNSLFSSVSSFFSFILQPIMNSYSFLFSVPFHQHCDIFPWLIVFSLPQQYFLAIVKSSYKQQFALVCSHYCLSCYIFPHVSSSRLLKNSCPYQSIFLFCPSVEGYN